MEFQHLQAPSQQWEVTCCEKPAWTCHSERSEASEVSRVEQVVASDSSLRSE
jgi:hypothetical protein